ncbi:mucin-2-like isoform X2 [Stegostoma tigrinum]|uniref:mucin-2-like isoform X2 n=1 Tax=Stegostoma tigrinum TaxID=3053191 RepID=UPI00202B4A35|nr:mucin-2-like isoform X2 [Stegostoma tigrinum]
MWAKFVLILCHHFILSLATNSPAPHGTEQSSFATTFLPENSSTTFSTHTSLTTNLQNATATSPITDVQTYPLSSSAPIALTNTSHVTSTVVDNSSLNTTSQRFSPQLSTTTVLPTAAPNITLNSSDIATSYSLITSSSSQTDNTTDVNSTIYSPRTNNMTHTTSLYPVDTNSSFTSLEATSLPNSTQHKEFTTMKVSTITFTTPDAFTTILSSSNPTSLPNTSTMTNNTERQDRIESPSKADLQHLWDFTFMNSYNCYSMLACCLRYSRVGDIFKETESVL